MGPALKTQTSTAGPSLPRETERRGARILGHTEKAPLTRRPVVRGPGTSEPPEGRWPLSAWAGTQLCWSACWGRQLLTRVLGLAFGRPGFSPGFSLASVGLLWASGE